MKDTIVVLTGRSIVNMVEAGGSQAWRLVADHARRMTYVVCTRNNRATWSDGVEKQRSAFLIAKIRDVVPAPEDSRRWMVRFAEYATIDKPEAWRKGDRNPVHYSSLAELGISLKKLDWVTVDVTDEPAEPALVPERQPKAKPLTIMEAKNGLAMTFNVPIEAIEITIRA